MAVSAKLSYLFCTFTSVFIMCLLSNKDGLCEAKNGSNVSTGRQHYLSPRSKRFELQGVGGNYFINPLQGSGGQRPEPKGSRFTEEYYTNSEEDTPYTAKPKRNKKKNKVSEVVEDENIESKTQEIPDQLAVETAVINNGDLKEQKDDSRACTACTSGDCAPNTVISGLPAIQIMVAMVAGAVCAAIFIFLYKNFIDAEPESSGYGYAAAMPQSQYGAPQPQYGAPQSQYGAPQTQYGSPPKSGYGRSFGGFDFNQLSNFVWKALDKFSDSSVTSPTGN